MEVYLFLLLYIYDRTIYFEIFIYFWFWFLFYFLSFPYPIEEISAWALLYVQLVFLINVYNIYVKKHLLPTFLYSCKRI